MDPMSFVRFCILSPFFAMTLLTTAWLGAAKGQNVARSSQWYSGAGEWSDAAQWNGGVPDAMCNADIRGPSTVRLPGSTRSGVVGFLKAGTHSGDRVRLHLDGGALVARRGYIHAGEADDSSVEISLDAGALHGVSGLYLGGSGESKPGACRATLTIRGGSFVCRFVMVGAGQKAEATLAIEGSRAEAVHVLDYLMLGVPVKDRVPSMSTLAFTLDEHGVTPVTIASRRTGLVMNRYMPASQCRLRIALSAVPPRGDVTLVAANAPAAGTFDELPEGSEVRASHAGREYLWTLTYRGGKSGCDLALTRVRGHAAGAPITACRALPVPPSPLWESLPTRGSHDAPAGPLAFDGAEGFGSRAAGGRDGKALWVENLNDGGPGSFRAAVQERGPRNVEFRVAGEIVLKSPLSITEPFLTVNGQSAPGGGVTFTGNGFVVRTHDVVLRHFRIRSGDTTEDTDVLSFYDAERCTADHLSLSWGTDEVLSVTGLSDTITVQWCIISEGLNRTQHGYASIAGGERVTWHHNLFAHHVSRVPRFAGITRTDFRNNVLYNWGHTAGYGEFECMNYVANYLKPGPSTTQKPPLFHLGDAVVGKASVFLEGNRIHGGKATNRDNWLGTGFGPEARAFKPFVAPPVRTSSAEQAYEAVLKQAGALPAHRDPTDTRIVREVRTGSGKIIGKVSDAAP